MDTAKTKRRKSRRKHSSVPLGLIRALLRVGLLRFGIAIGVALPVALLAVAVTAGNVLARSSPEVALAVWPFSAEAQARLASERLNTEPPEGMNELADLSRRALRRQPLNPTAASVLARIAQAQGDTRRAANLFSYAQALSRRNAEVQLWYIEDRVAAGDIHGALRHYDRALRTSPELYGLLMPILVEAADDPLIAPPLDRVLIQDPPWAIDFLHRLATTGTNSQTIARILRARNLNPNNPGMANIISLATERMVELGNIELARSFHGSNAATGLHGEAVNNGGFEAMSTLPPFDWSYETNDSITAYVDGVLDGGSGSALTIVAREPGGGDGATQLLTLATGQYILSARIGAPTEPSTSTPRISVRCGHRTADGSRLGVLTHAQGRGEEAAMRFTVPAQNCEIQTLAISLAGSIERSEVRGWVDDVSVVSR